jgi:hypothetical protein
MGSKFVEIEEGTSILVNCTVCSLLPVYNMDTSECESVSWAVARTAQTGLRSWTLNFLGCAAGVEVVVEEFPSPA